MVGGLRRGSTTVSTLFPLMTTRLRTPEPRQRLWVGGWEVSWAGSLESTVQSQYAQLDAMAR